ncbi:hypothetical protein O3M35_011862 [Rhynocoris fuscipes]|uniref:ApaG domain-containing protein n=1 Tax=Rhynocoris fuscipes TaxID=488301 RepID=A0AAW1CX82_9HEMI
MSILEHLKTVILYKFYVPVLVGKARYAADGIKASVKHKVQEVGKLDHPKKRGEYSTGQLFLHKIFGYRGIILFSWKPVVINRDLPITKSKSYLINKIQQMPEMDDDIFLKKRRYYYQVLIDNRDIDHTRATTEPATFIITQNRNKSLYAIPALDYVSHDDIIPYMSTEKTPFQHDLLKRFFIHVPNNDPQYLGHAALRTWKQWNETWLETTRVITETTQNVKITVMPFYLGEKTNHTYWWRYCVRIQNQGVKSLKLKGRLVRLYNGSSNYLQTLRGKKELSEQDVVLDKANPAYQYTSHVTLDVPVAYAWGSMSVEREDGHTFDCKIPLFTLDCVSDSEMM